MPLTDELGGLVLGELRAEGLVGPPSGFAGGYFEAWLSRLAEPQPDLPDHANLHNQAWFSRITEQAHSVLANRQAQALTSSAPDWLLRLIGVCHVTSSTIVTFNYDLLIEAALNTSFVYDWLQRQRATSRHAVRNLPAEPVRAGMFARSPADTFHLIKLHGSLDCWWVGSDATGATIQRDQGWAAFNRDDVSPTESRPPGLVPFMVPPASAKSRFYANPVTRALWQNAAAALGRADTVDLIGYSLPVTDLVATGMLTDRLSGRNADVRVLNPSPAAPIAALKAMGLEPTTLDVELQGYTAEWEADLALTAASELDSLDAELPALVGHHPGNLQALVLQPEGGLAAEDPRPWTPPTRRREPRDAPIATVADVRRVAGAGRLTVRDRDEHRAVIGWRRHLEETGQSNAWAVGLTSWSPPPDR